jgi:hypothetical protein
MVDFRLPAESSGEIVPIDRLEAVPVLSGIARWRRLCAGRRFPARTDSIPREFGALLANVILVRVLEDGADYEYRVVGQALVPAFGINFAGRRLSDIIAQTPKFGLGLRMLYDMVRSSGEPLGYRGWVGQDMTGAEFVYHENALLPFGPRADAVDHLLIVSMTVPRPGARME